MMRACWEFPAGEETQQQSQLKRLLCDTLLLARDQSSRSLAHAQPPSPSINVSITIGVAVLGRGVGCDAAERGQQQCCSKQQSGPA
jgi:hypothetical protein